MFTISISCLANFCTCGGTESPSLPLPHPGTLLVTLCSDSQQATQQEIRYLQLSEDLRQGPHCTQHLPHHAVRPAQCGVDLGAHAWNRGN
ncbi:hypothetical protein E2C01_085641 [Portunus trituberculatus]|uniref:Uncharacterized protein n=1 Tax=Portunus trituberculatus TaxID=210409 RepID=A0A5B7J7E5_PORTR|nr:hypothetical protein [Portunus trituberculatus]